VKWPFDTTFARDLPWLGVATDPVPVAEPGLLVLNEELADELGLDPVWLRSPHGVAVLSGNATPEGSQPIAQAYAGHQFGSFSPLLGDGRAHLLGEMVDSTGQRRDIALKGSGQTAFSRRGDGRAVVGPVLREFLIGEAMDAFGIPTTRALAAVSTGETVAREQLEPGAVLTRVAASHLRVGTVELVATQGTKEQLLELIEYARARHYPELPVGDPMALLSGVVARQAELIAQWLAVGFIHGVMNTDNMTLSGETIDYGPCAFLDTYDPNAVFSSIDRGGRYRYAAQPQIAMWNLARLAEALLPAVDDPPALLPEATERVQAFGEVFAAAHLRRFRAKLGLTPRSAHTPDPECDETDRKLIDDLLGLLHMAKLDFTGTFRQLAGFLRGEVELPLGLTLAGWPQRWLDRLGPADRAATAEAMDRVNPAYIPRNHLVEEALAAARTGDLGPFEDLLAVVREPFTVRPGRERYAEPAPARFTESFVTYCGT
jgi:uncharacterized protein YdiU (UPF0061 family)